MSVAPNDQAVVAGLSDNLATLINEFKSYVDAWQERVDAVVVRLQNAGASEELADGSVTGQVPPGVAPQPEPQPSVETPVETPPAPSTEPTGLSTVPAEDTGVPADDIGSTPPEDSSVPHHFSDPSGDDTITDPSGDDVQL